MKMRARESRAGVSPAPGRTSEGRRDPCPTLKTHGFLLIEVLVYIAVVFVLLGVGYSALYHCMDSSIALRRDADDIANALHAGERWRADVRQANKQIRVEQTPAEQIAYLEGLHSEAAYRFSTNAVFRRVSEGPWVRLLSNVKSSTIESDARQRVTAWRWELELQPRQKGSVKPGRIHPLFTFIAVPERSPAK
jgi:type II secretory pathway component PulJ